MADDPLTAELEEIRSREQAAAMFPLAELAECDADSGRVAASAMDVPRLRAALELLLKEHAPYVTRGEYDRLAAILRGEGGTDG